VKCYAPAGAFTEKILSRGESCWRLKYSDDERSTDVCYVEVRGKKNGNYRAGLKNKMKDYQKGGGGTEGKDRK